MSGLDYNHNLFIQEFINLLEGHGYYLKKSFDDSNKGDRFYKTGYKKKSKAFGRYKYIPANQSSSGYPLIMWTVFAELDKSGKVLIAATTEYFWFKPDEGSQDKQKNIEDNKKRAEEYRKLQIAREIEEKKLQQSFRTNAYTEYLDLKDDVANVDNHEYIKRKKIKAARGLVIANKDLKIGSFYNQYKQNQKDMTFYFVKKGDLLIPAINEQREFVTYQKINSDGTKRQRIDISTVGAFYPFGKIDGHTKKAYLCEGYATGYSLNTTCDKDEVVLVCFDVNNIGVVAEILKDLYPNLMIVFCTDNDRKKKTRVGLFKGFEYGYRFNMPFVFPRFEDTKENEDKSDWNDLAQIAKVEEMRDILMKQESFFLNMGKDVAIRAACASYGVSMEELAEYAVNFASKYPELFKTVFVK